jgi:hypothetical protein
MKELMMFAIVYVYGVIELLLDLSSDPLYFMPIEGNEVKEILGMGSVIYVIVYVLVICVWVNAFYLIPMLKNKLSKKK